MLVGFDPPRNADVIIWADRTFLIQLFRVSEIPDHVAFKSYHRAACSLLWTDGSETRHDSTVHRPSHHRNVAGQRTIDQIAVLLRSDRSLTDGSLAAVRIDRWDGEISLDEAKATAGPYRGRGA